MVFEAPGVHPGGEWLSTSTHNPLQRLTRYSQKGHKKENQNRAKRVSILKHYRSKPIAKRRNKTRTKHEQNTNKKRVFWVGKLSFEARMKLEDRGFLRYWFPDTGTARLRQGFTKPTLRFIDTIHARENRQKADKARTKL